VEIPTRSPIALSRRDWVMLATGFGLSVAAIAAGYGLSLAVGRK